MQLHGYTGYKNVNSALINI